MWFLLAGVLLQAPKPCGNGAGTDRAASDYLDVIDAYIRGDYERSADALRNSSEFDTSLPRLLLGDTCRQAATMAHTEAAMSLTRGIQFTLASLQIRIARRWIDSMEATPAEERFRRDWLIALATFYHQSIFILDPSAGLGEVEEVVGGPRARLFLEARRFYDEAVDDFEDDPEVLVSAGAFYEWSGTLSTEARILRKAEKLYALAIALDPANTEAQLRYGRALEKRGRYTDARTPLTKAAENAETAYLATMAKLLLGRVEQKTGHVSEAIDLYRNAIELLPEWQVSYVALSYALHVSGRREESREVLAEAIQRKARTDEAFQGWWAYERGHADQFEGLWVQMKAALER